MSDGGDQAGNGVWVVEIGDGVEETAEVEIRAGAEMGDEDLAESGDAALAVEIGDPQCRRRGRVWGLGAVA